MRKRMVEKDEDGLGAGSAASQLTSCTWESPLSLSGLRSSREPVEAGTTRCR